MCRAGIFMPKVRYRSFVTKRDRAYFPYRRFLQISYPLNRTIENWTGMKLLLLTWSRRARRSQLGWNRFADLAIAYWSRATFLIEMPAQLAAIIILPRASYCRLRSEYSRYLLRGWQRAGAWAALFGSSLGGSNYPRPAVIYAATPGEADQEDHGPSRRPAETISALAGRLKLTPSTKYAQATRQVL